jgi:hypothetical protein
MTSNLKFCRCQLNNSRVATAKEATCQNMKISTSNNGIKDNDVTIPTNCGVLHISQSSNGLLVIATLYTILQIPVNFCRDFCHNHCMSAVKYKVPCAQVTVVTSTVFSTAR